MKSQTRHCSTPQSWSKLECITTSLLLHKYETVACNLQEWFQEHDTIKVFCTAHLEYNVPDYCLTVLIDHTSVLKKTFPECLLVRSKVHQQDVILKGEIIARELITWTYATLLQPVGNTTPWSNLHPHLSAGHRWRLAKSQSAGQHIQEVTAVAKSLRHYSASPLCGRYFVCFKLYLLTNTDCNVARNDTPRSCCFIGAHPTTRS